MNLLDAALLGIVQGFTEFLPVSSSGHLVIAQDLLGVDVPGALFEAILHAGTTLAIIVMFYKRILSFRTKEIVLLAIGSIPAAFVGILFQPEIEAIFDSTSVVGIALVITGILNIAIDRTKADKKELKPNDAFMIGLAQAIAIIPGISRSGSTIFAGTQLSINRATAAEFSFLLSIPAILGATLLQLTSHDVITGANFGFMFLGFVSAFISGVFAISLVMRLLTHKRFYIFGIYTIIVGILVFFFLG